MMNEIDFNAETHTYTVNGEILKSVTTIIKEAGLIDTRWFNEAACWRGSAVHEAVFFDIHEDLDVDHLHDIVRPYVNAWLKFKNDTKFRPLKSLCESRCYHPYYKYAGSPDLVGFLNGSIALIDIKTGECPTAGIQTVAYSIFPTIMACSPKRFSLRLRPDGTYRLNPHADKNDLSIFLDALKKVTTP